MGRFRFSNARRIAAALREEEEENPARRGWSFRRFLSPVGEVWVLRPPFVAAAPPGSRTALRGPFGERLSAPRRAARNGAAPGGFASVPHRNACGSRQAPLRGRRTAARLCRNQLRSASRLRRNFPVSSGTAVGGSDSGRALPLLRRLQPGAALGAAGRGRGAAVRSGNGADGGSWGIWGTSASRVGDKRNARRSAASRRALTDALRRFPRPRARPRTAPGGGSRRAETALSVPSPERSCPCSPRSRSPRALPAPQRGGAGAAAPSGRDSSAAAPRPSAGPSRRRLSRRGRGYAGPRPLAPAGLFRSLFRNTPGRFPPLRRTGPARGHRHSGRSRRGERAGSAGGDRHRARPPLGAGKHTAAGLRGRARAGGAGSGAGPGGVQIRGAEPGRP